MRGGGASDRDVLDALLDSWDRSNRITVGLLRLVPSDGMDDRATPDSFTVAQMFAHLAYNRLLFVQENAPEHARPIPPRAWREHERDADVLATALDESARAVASAVRAYVESGRPMARHYDHPILLLQHMLWHDGYHHGQIKLALKRAGRALDDEVAGAVTWDLWMDRTR